MIGFELHIDKKIISASIPNGSIHVIVDIIGNKSNLILTGLDVDTGEYLDWYKKELKMGDECILRIVDVKKNSLPKEKRVKMSKEKLIEQKLKSYEALKKELEGLHLI